MNLSLIGYRGSGKSTVAKRLAEELGWPAIDADDEIERTAGKSIKQIFAEDGEPAFRDWESKIVAELSARDRHVLAWGGGAVLREENRRAIRAAGPVVWLRADSATIHRRVKEDPTTDERRPNLTVAGGFDEIDAVLRERTPIYQQCADFEVDTEGMTPAEVAAAIATWLNRRLSGSE